MSGYQGRPADSGSQGGKRKSADDPTISYEDDTFVPSRELDEDPFGAESPDPVGIWGRVKPVKPRPDGPDGPGADPAPRPTPSTVHTSSPSLQTPSQRFEQRCPICRVWPCVCGAERHDGKDPYSGTGIPPQGSTAASQATGNTSRASTTGTTRPQRHQVRFQPQPHQGPPASASRASNSVPDSSQRNRQNEYFVPRDGIDREVITADICRYLGNDALVRPGNYETADGRVIQGYYITAYRNLTSTMIQDLKADSSRWDEERRTQQTRGSARGHSYNAMPRYPGRDTPGYSAGAGFSTGGAPSAASIQAYGAPSSSIQPGHDNFNYPPPGTQMYDPPGYTAQPVYGSSYTSLSPQLYGGSGYPAQPVDAFYGRGAYTSSIPYPARSTYPATSRSSSDSNYPPSGPYPPAPNENREHQ